MPSRPKLPRKLQALLLLGGAFVVLGVFWLSRYRLIRDQSVYAPAEAVAAIELGREINDRAWRAFVLAQPEDAQVPLAQLFFETHAIAFASPDDTGRLRWHIAWPEKSGPLRWVPRTVQGAGFIVVGGRRQPATATFHADHIEIRAGRAYRGLSFVPSPFSPGRRLITPIHQQLAYLEKPEGVVWDGISAVFERQLQRFRSLAEPWRWPGRVELSVSASSTGASLHPFVLYYQPPGGAHRPEEVTGAFAKALLAEAAPQPLHVTLPDDSSMTELRYEPEAVQIQTLKNSFGGLFKLSVPGSTQKFTLFKTHVGETWLSNDTSLIQSAILNSIQAIKAESTCEKGGAAGFASFGGGLFSSFGDWKKVSISIHNSDTGLFTICGYY